MDTETQYEQIVQNLAPGSTAEVSYQVYNYYECKVKKPQGLMDLVCFCMPDVCLNERCNIKSDKYDRWPGFKY